MVKVSVIIPNYNHSKFLETRIQTVLNQTYQDFEIILLDDASNDNSLQVLNKYKSNDKVSYFEINKKNTGIPFKQWKKGINHAKGEYIWIAESDDFSDINFLKITVEILDQHKNFGFVSIAPTLVDQDGNIIENTSFKKNSNAQHISNHLKILTSKDYIRGYFNSQNAIYNASGVLFRNKKELFGNSYYKKRQLGDTFFWAQFYLNNYDVAFLDLPLSFFRQHPHNLTKINFEENRKNVLLEEYQFIHYLILNSDDSVLSKEDKNVMFNRLCNKCVRYNRNFNFLPFKSFDKNFLIEVKKIDELFYVRYLKLFSNYVFRQAYGRLKKYFSIF